MDDLKQHEREAAVAHRAVTMAGMVTRHVQQRLSAGDSLSKSDDSPVTIADYAAQAVVVHELRSLGKVIVVGEESSAQLRRAESAALRAATLAAVRVALPTMSEEGMLELIDGGDSQIGGAGSFWTVDPIDGTKGFLRGHQYAVCLALIERGAPVVAAMACPNLSIDPSRPFTDPDPHGMTVVAARGAPEGSRVWWTPADELGAEPRGLERIEKSGGGLRFCQSFDAEHSDHSMTTRLIVRLRARGIESGPPMNISSQAKYVVVGRGLADVLVRRGRTIRREWIWDVAPGALIAECAGLRVTDASGKELDFSLGKRLEANHGILAAEPGVHGVVLGELGQV